MRSEGDKEPGIVLRVLRRGDARVLAALLTTEGETVREWLPWPPEALTPRGLRRVIRDAARELGRSGAFLAGIRRNGELVGIVGLFDVAAGAGGARLAYWVTAPHRGRGVATAACRLLVAHAFAVMKLRFLELHCAAHNAAARAVAERLGFRLDTPPDSSADLVSYVLEASEWPQAAEGVC